MVLCYLVTRDRWVASLTLEAVQERDIAPDTRHLLRVTNRCVTRDSVTLSDTCYYSAGTTEFEIRVDTGRRCGCSEDSGSLYTGEVRPSCNPLTSAE